MIEAPARHLINPGAAWHKKYAAIPASERLSW
jgi:hypothetical protein